MSHRLALLLLCAVALIARTASTPTTRYEGPSSADNMLHRSVALQTSVLDTRASADFVADLRFEAYLAQFGAATRHQFIAHIKAPVAQFKSTIENELQLQFATYLPYNSFLFVGTQSEALRVRAHRDVLWVGGYDSEHRVAVELRPESSEASGEPPRALLVKLAPSTTSADWLAAEASSAASLGGERASVVKAVEPLALASGEQRVRIELVDGTSWSSVARLAAHLAQLPTTHWIEPLRVNKLFNQYLSTVIFTGEAFGSTTPLASQFDGADSTIGIIDTGVDSASCFITGRVVGQVNGDGGDGADKTLHGTAMATTCCGSGLGAGVARAARIHSTDIGDGDGNIKDTVDLGALLNGAKTAGASIIVIAFGSRAKWYNAAAFDIDKFAAANPEVLVVVAAGNEGFQGAGTIASTGYSKNAIVVGAHQNAFEGFKASLGAKVQDSQALVNWMGVYRAANGPSVVSSLSSRGPTADGRIKPDVVATGEFVLTAGRGNCALASAKGTSLSAAAVAGAAALVTQWLKMQPGQTTPKASMIKAVLIHSGQPMPSLAVSSDASSTDRIQSAGPWPSFNYGFGRVALDNVIARAGSAVPTFQLDLTDGAAMPRATASKCFQVEAGGSLRATLVWTDAAGSESAGAALVNDLDLVVWRGKDGFEWRGNGGASFDSLNTVESVMLEPVATAGVYGVAVSGAHISGASQAYSLVVTGQFSVTPCPAVGSCPLNCNDAGTCAQGACTCSGAAGGADCTALLCPANCNGNGACDSATGRCTCGRGFTGDNCAQQQAPMTTITELVNLRVYDTGISDGLFGGLLFLAYLIGCFCALFCGGFIGAKMMQRRRDAQMSR